MWRGGGGFGLQAINNKVKRTSIRLNVLNMLSDLHEFLCQCTFHYIICVIGRIFTESKSLYSYDKLYCIFRISLFFLHNGNFELDLMINHLHCLTNWGLISYFKMSKQQVSK